MDFSPFQHVQNYHSSLQLKIWKACNINHSHYYVDLKQRFCFLFSPIVYLDFILNWKAFLF